MAALDVHILRRLSTAMSGTRAASIDVGWDRKIESGNRINEDCYMGDDDNDDDDGDSWIEEIAEPTTHCLFCPSVFRSVEDALPHCINSHAFDLTKLKIKHKMDCYSYIKMVNYIRTKKCVPQDITGCADPVWMDDVFMKPVIDEDPWLMFDIEDVEESMPMVAVCRSGISGYHVNAEDGRVTLSEQHFAELQRTIQSLTAQKRELQTALDGTQSAMTRMRVTLGGIVAGGATEPSAKGVEGDMLINNSIASLHLRDDEGYFNTYSHFGIHHEMLSDTVRTQSYRDALQLNRDLVAGRSVLDLGCGTAVLSMFAATAGASRVIAIDNSDIIYHAMDIIRENGLSGVVEIVKGRIEDTELPSCSHVDVIVCEWMGYFLLFEAMLDSLIYARDHHLAPGGLLLPNRCTISLVGCSDPARHAETVGFWSDVYGYRMSCLRREVLREPSIEIVQPACVSTQPALLTSLDLYTCTTRSLEFSGSFELTANRGCQLTALAGYFDTFFDLPQPVSFSTGPHALPTHWKQTVFLIQEPIPMKQGEVLSGSLICQRHRKEVRSLIVKIAIGGQKQEYILG